MLEQDLHKWEFKFSEDKRKRVVIEYIPFNDHYIFFGQIKPRGYNWMNYCQFIIEKITEESFVETISKIQEDLNTKENRIESMDTLCEHFKDYGIKLIDSEETTNEKNI